jgi:flagellar protein FlaG
MIDIKASGDIAGVTTGSDTGVLGGSGRVDGVAIKTAAARQVRETQQDHEVQKKTGDAQVNVSREKLDKAISQLTDYVQRLQHDLHFDVHEDTGRMVISVVDRHTQELVRQIPEEVVLDLAQKLNAEEPMRLFSARI